ncbi:MAG: 50S ribosomal protein L17 [Ignavibacteriae bacterium HGW-Ignavibacteriae-2]|jgi:large subunit ribosomal protein L17|nr:MAG: 50S ribosomal protein L17 [Ignavibacteriae bacterium HGW-Ignavibacteriae-2]
MRHRVKGRKLGRTSSHRAATLQALATALFKHKKIKTTLAKAKETRSFVEPLITKAKDDSVARRRFVARFIKDKDVLKELFSEIVPKIGDRPGGYTRIVKLGNRAGDAAEMALIELVDFNVVEVKSEPKTKAKAKVKTKKVEEKVEAAVEEPKPKAKTRSKAKAKKEEIEDANVIEEVVKDEASEGSEEKSEEK